MIRRELTMADGSVSWLLISQVEHAGISGLVARHWKSADLSPYECDGLQLPAATTDEILAAITHHDDGWAQWEARPRIDPAHGRPYSFRNELPLPESLAIWDGSIAFARQIGPLAGWMVAGHFSELLQDGNHTNDDRAAGWLREKRALRDAWLAEWLRVSTNNSPRIAERALYLLQACDFLSLWLCCECPVSPNELVKRVEPFVLHRPREAVGPYRFTAHQEAAKTFNVGAPVHRSGWFVAPAPWPFDDAKLALTADAWIVPAVRFNSGDDMMSTAQSIKLSWRLVPKL